jgi:hypothetical protein
MNIYDTHTKFQMPRPDGILSSPYRNLKPDFTQDMLFLYVLQKRKITLNCLTKLVCLEDLLPHITYFRTPSGASAATNSEIRAPAMLLPTAENLRILGQCGL